LAAPSSEAGRSVSPYFINGPVDFLFIGGLSILVYLLLGFMQILEMTWLTWTSLVVASNFLLAFPHFFASSYRLYHTKENIRQYPMTAIALPIVLVACAAGSLTWPTLFAPVFIKIFLFWSPYHYAAQSVGVSLLYARRAGFVIGGFERWTLSAFILSTFILITARENVAAKDNAFWGIIYPSFRLPEWAPDLALLWTCVTAVLLAFAVVRWSIRNGRMLPPIVLVPVVAQVCWFVVGGSVPLYYIFLPAFHSLQYLFLAWSTQLKEVKDERGIQPSRRFVVRETLRWSVFVVVGGVAIFRGLPLLLEAGGYTWALSFAAVAATANIHHFFVDGVIWKLRNPRVGSILTTDLRELTGASR
jgi:hypothetical protein